MTHDKDAIRAGLRQKNKKIKIGRGIFGPGGQITGIETGLNQVGTVVVGLVMQHVTIIKSYT